MVCLDGKPIGAISVTPSPVNGHRTGEMGYVLASEYWGRGIVTKAVNMALKAVLQEVEGLERVEALVDVENAASQRVLDKEAGFVKEGVLRKYGVLKGVAKDMIILL
ncbi:uncharacterized protein A4U43_C07F32730 [Asparagus officinalis]|uniref:N-acetyltransferase domain-containing protein n=1 Tax=Asparagus officinalis TaxID=4686 RepID=A0A5P1EJR2_ASPOF|nr:uncharacterized protein A4U43_C07F32730 [Asparagus officinalis]